MSYKICVETAVSEVVLVRLDEEFCMKDIFAVVVIYKVALADSVTYRSILSQGGIEEFLVYDNSPSDYHQQTTTMPDGAIYVRDVNNSGLPKAYNMAAEMARDRGYTHLLLLDQDTEFAPNTLSLFRKTLSCQKLCAPIIRTKEQDPFSPVCVAGWRPRAVRHPHAGLYSLGEYAVVNSGCCIPLQLFLRTGGYASDVRLDFADFQFQGRLKKYCAQMLILDTVAVQDFSNDGRCEEKLFARFCLYLESAAGCVFENAERKWKHRYTVLRHTLALTLRQRNPLFLKEYVKRVILGSR